MEELPGADMFFMRARYYWAEPGVFLSTDPVKHIGPGWKPIAYSYAGGNPLSLLDPAGLKETSGPGFFATLNVFSWAIFGTEVGTDALAGSLTGEELYDKTVNKCYSAALGLAGDSMLVPRLFATSNTGEAWELIKEEVNPFSGWGESVARIKSNLQKMEANSAKYEPVDLTSPGYELRGTDPTFGQPSGGDKFKVDLSGNGSMSQQTPKYIMSAEKVTGESVETRIDQDVKISQDTGTSSGSWVSKAWDGVSNFFGSLFGGGGKGGSGGGGGGGGSGSGGKSTAPTTGDSKTTLTTPLPTPTPAQNSTTTAPPKSNNTANSDGLPKHPVVFVLPLVLIACGWRAYQTLQKRRLATAKGQL